MVTPRDADAYALLWNIDDGKTCAPSCTVADFKIDLLGKPSSAWNKSASRTFCRSFLDFHDLPENPTLIDSVKAAFFTRIKSLKTMHGVSLLQEHERQEVVKQKRRYRRKYLVCNP